MAIRRRRDNPFRSGGGGWRDDPVVLRDEAAMSVKWPSGDLALEAAAL